MNRSSHGSVKVGRIPRTRTLRRRGYVASVVGTVVGGIGLSGLGGYLGNEYARRYVPNADVGALLRPLLVGFLGGYWIGTIFGAWAALRFRSYQGRLATAALVGLLAPLMYPALAAVQSVIPSDRTLLPWIAAVLVLAGIGAAARAIALRFGRRGEQSKNHR